MTLIWSENFPESFAGEPANSVTATSDSGTIPGEFVITRTGIEGSLVYAHAASSRDRLEKKGKAMLLLDLVRPGRTAERLARDLTLAGHQGKLLHSPSQGYRLVSDGVKAALVRTFADAADITDAERLAQTIKGVASASGQTTTHSAGGDLVSGWRILGKR